MITLALIGLIGGLITGVSPCVLPMLPIIFFAGSSTVSGPPTGEPAVEGDTLVATKKKLNTRPLKIIAGLVTSFSIITLFGTTLLSFLGLPDDFLLWVGLIVLTVVGVGLIVPAVGHVIEKPFYRLPKISNPDSGAFLFGMGLGTLYVPCAGPVLAAIVVAGATGDVGIKTVVLTVSFALGAALPLLFFAAAGARAGERIKSYRAKAQQFRVASGIVLILLAVALAFDAPAALQKALPNYTGGLEKKVAESKTVQGALSPLSNDENKDLARCIPGSPKLASCGVAPSIKGTQQTFNADGGPIDLADYRGKVVLVDFFAYSCINCQRDAPHLADWNTRYKDAGLQIIGIHSPEFAFEKSAGNLKSAIRKEKLTYPIAQDNNLSTWTNYRNRYWPAKYLIDAKGTVRAIKFGEGSYDQTESQIRRLLKVADPSVTLPKPSGMVGTHVPAGTTPETYFGYSGNTNYVGDPKVLLQRQQDYLLRPGQPDDTYSLGGRWTVETKYAEAGKAARSRLNFTATKVFHVLAGTGTVTIEVEGEKTRTITVDGTPNLYEIYSAKTAQRKTMTLEYSKGLEAYTFAFG
jgi:cytochrome c biogenesis protein CcdA/thiol-disulfide isomerase/thioredoxin